MSDRIHLLAQQIFNKPSLEACDVEEIRSVAERYPYFAPVQFLLLEKLKNENDPGYQAQLQRSVLYYHNPVAFEYFIASNRFYSDAEIAPAEAATEETIQVPFLPENFQQEASTEEVKIEEEQPREEDQTVNELPNGISKVPESVSSLGEEEPVYEDEKPLEPELPMEEPPRIPSPVMVPLESSAALSFEPYHTVDYFASQGIKLSQEAEPSDQFGRQLKSFTEWLRTMKKIPAQVVSVEKPNQSEERVQHLAEDSVHQAEVLTETMAEVWLKQGNTEKAIETYNKLSLLNPSKKAYFAARIENLKRS